LDIEEHSEGHTEEQPLDPYRSTIYDQFRKRAHALLKQRGDHRDPETISLVNNVYMGLLRTGEAGNLPEFDDAAELLKYLAKAMRNHLVNRAEARLAARRPPEDRRLEWPESHSFPATARKPQDLLDIHEALRKLSGRDQRAAQVVELIFFGGCTQNEVAEILGVPPRSIRSDWEFARAWLRDQLQSHGR